MRTKKLLKSGVLIAAMLAVSMGYSKNGDDENPRETKMSFYEDCDAADVPFTQDFESVTAPDLPPCGTLETISGNDWKTKNAIDYGFDSTVLTYSYSTATAANTWYFMQGVNLEAGVNYQIIYKYGNRGSYAEKLKVAFGTSAQSSSMDTELVDHTNILGVEMDEIFFTVPADGVYYFGFNAHSNINQNELYVDDILINVAPTCISPSDVVIDNVTTESADISWTAGGDESEWEILYGEAGFDIDSEGTSEEVMTNSATLENLESNTSYDIYVRSVCAADDKSEWEGPAVFSTSCLATDLPFTQDFEGVTTPDLPDCGTLEANNGEGWITYNQTSDGFDSNIIRSKYTGYGAGAVDVWYFTQGINLETGQDYQIKFKYGNNSTFYTEKLKVAYGTSTEGSAMINEIVDFDNIQGVNGEVAEINFTVDEDGVYYFGFQAHSAENQAYLYVDDIHIDVAPTCIHTEDLAVDNITPDSADISWTAGAEEQDQWEVLYGEANFDTDSEGTSKDVMDDPITTFDNLESNTAYDVYVRADCGSGDKSSWEGPVSFITACGGATDIPFMQDFDMAEIPEIPQCATLETNAGPDWKTKSSVSGFEGNVLNHSYDSSNDLDAWYFTQGINLEAGVDYQISYKYTNGSTIYTEKLKVAFGTSPSSGDMTEELVDNENINSTEVLIDEINFSVDADGVYYFGFQAHSDADQNQLYVDDIHIDAAPTCAHPNDIVIDADDITISSANISWTAGDSETEWEVLYGEAGFDPDNDEGTSVNVMDDPNTILDGLDSDTEYEVYVRAICSEDDESELEGPESFTTLISCPVPTDLEVDEIGQNTADVSWTASGDETEWKVVYGEAGFDPDNDEGMTADVMDDPNTTLTGLDTGTTYKVYVKAVCSEDDESELEGPVSFSTTCEAAPIPFNEGFESGYTEGNVLSGCWSQEEGEWKTKNQPDTHGRKSRTGDWYVSLIYGSDDWIFYALDLTGGTAYELSFYARQDAATGATVMASFGTGNSAAEMTSEIISSTDVNSDDYEEFSGNFTPDSDGVYYIGIKGTTTFTPWYLTIDDIAVTEAEAEDCLAPSDITFTETDVTSTQVSWTENGDATEWEVIYGETGFDPETEGETVSVNDTPETLLSNLEEDASYEVYVRAVCADDEMSDWAGPESFTTEMETCEAPTDIVIGDTTDSTVDVSWTAGGAETEWEVLYGETGFDPETEGEVVSVMDTPETVLEGLTEDTAYDVYVRALCGDDNNSDWTGPVTFDTELGVDSQVFENFAYYPNPVQGQLTLKAGMQIERVTVYNLLGQEVINVKPNTLQTQINVENLQVAVYMMKVNINGNTKIFRIIKE